MMRQVNGTRWAQLMLAATTSLVVALVCWKIIGEYRGARNRGVFALTILRHQIEGLKGSDSGRDSLRPLVLGDEDPELQRGLVVDLIRHWEPGVTSRKLDSLTAKKRFSATMSAALFRWKTALVEWQRAETPMEASALLEMGVALYGQAAGYDRLGLTYDATVIHLRSVHLLMGFIERAPNRVEVPQAVFLIGMSLLKLRQVMPRSVQPDRILNLCMELYPHSIWAARAYAVRRDELARRA